MALLYRIGIFLFGTTLYLGGYFNKRAKAWRNGRKNWREQYEKQLSPFKGAIWMHCASLGEFEQGRPVLEAIRKRHPQHKIILSFFSPSGFEQRKNWTGADAVVYLPLDTPSNARFLVDLIEPKLVIWVKYEFWMHFLYAIKSRQIPAVLVSAVFREDHYFLKPWAGWFRKGLQVFTGVFVQDEKSLRIAHSIALPAKLSGDTRFDRVAAIAAEAHPVEHVNEFVNDRFCIVAGSSWPPEEDMLRKFLGNAAPQTCLVIAPHQVDEAHLKSIEDKYGQTCVRYSKVSEHGAGSFIDRKVLLIDEVGLLSRLYKEADIAVIGGGFGAGIHNILEAAVYGVPVLFGPRHEKFREAKELLQCNAARTFNDHLSLQQHIFEMRSDEALRHASGEAAAIYVMQGCGASDLIMKNLAEIL